MEDSTHAPRHFQLLRDHEIHTARTQSSYFTSARRQREMHSFPFVDLIYFRFHLIVPAFTFDGITTVRQPTERNDSICLSSANLLFFVRVVQQPSLVEAPGRKTRSCSRVCVRRGDRSDYLFFPSSLSTARPTGCVNARGDDESVAASVREKERARARWLQTCNHGDKHAQVPLENSKKPR